MSSVDNALRRALRQLASGSAAVWQPELTTGQAARAETVGRWVNPPGRTYAPGTRL